MLYPPHLAEITVDLASLATIIYWLKVVVAVIAGGAITGFGLYPMGKTMLSRLKASTGAVESLKTHAKSPPKTPNTADTSESPPTSSDQLAPEGFDEHVAIVLNACPFATAEVKLNYLIQGLTEAQVLREEVQRMGGTLTKEPSSESVRRVAQ